MLIIATSTPERRYLREVAEESFGVLDRHAAVVVPDQRLAVQRRCLFVDAPGFAIVGVHARLRNSGAMPSQGCVCSQMRARRSTISSRWRGPLISSPTGRPSDVIPGGNRDRGQPADASDGRERLGIGLARILSCDDDGERTLGVVRPATHRGRKQQIRLVEECRNLALQRADALAILRLLNRRQHLNALDEHARHRADAVRVMRQNAGALEIRLELQSRQRIPFRIHVDAFEALASRWTSPAERTRR